MDNIGLMSETVNFIQGSKRNYDSSTMQGGVYFSKDSKEILLNGESYGNAVPADEEDLTSVNGALQLKDREVNADNFQSKGYVILRKNLVQQEDGSYKNILTSDMISQSNTTYEIRYDFDLNGVTINIPDDCILKFEGGSLNNGTLKFISIINIIGKGIKDNLNITSNINNQIINADIFETTDLSIILTALNDIRQRKIDSKVASTLYVTLKLTNNIYYINKDTDISNVKIIGLGQYTSAIYLRNGQCYSTSAKCLWCEKLTVILDKNNDTDAAIFIYAREASETISRGVCYLNDINFLCLANNRLSDFQSPTTFGEQNNAKAFYCDASQGFYPLTIKNINILRYKYGIYLDGKDTGWITIGRLENIYINKTHIGIYLQKITGISLTNISIDCDDEYVETDNYANYAMYLKNVYTCSIVNFENFNDSGDHRKKVYAIYSINCTNVIVNGNSIEGVIYDDKDFSNYIINARFHSLYRPNIIGQYFLNIDQSKKISPIRFTDINQDLSNCVVDIDNNSYLKISYGNPLIFKFEHKASSSGFYLMFKHRSNCNSFDSTPVPGGSIADKNTGNYAEFQYNNKEEEFAYLYVTYNKSNEYAIQINTGTEGYINYINIESLRIVDNGISFAALNCNRILLNNKYAIASLFKNFIEKTFEDSNINTMECCLDSYSISKFIISRLNSGYVIRFNNFEYKGQAGDLMYVLSKLKIVITGINLFSESYENYNDDSEPIGSVEILNNCILSNGIKYLMCTTDNDIHGDYITIDNKNISFFNKKILPTDTNLDLMGYNIPTIETGTNRGFMFFDSNKNQIKVWDGKQWVKQSVLNDDFIVDSAHRPTNPQTGCQIYDMNLKKPIWWTGEKWVNSMGIDADSGSWTIIE